MPRNSAFQLTVLTTAGANATKTFYKSEGSIQVEGYGKAKYFTADTIDIDRKGEWLRKLGPKKHSFVILGEPIDWKPGEQKRRLSSTRDESSATIRDVPRALMPIDVDHIDFEPWAEIDDGEQLALELLERLGLKGIECVWHLTSGHGFFGKYRARLWITLSDPATAADMKAYAKSQWGDDKIDTGKALKSVVDFSVYQPQQPIYTANPILTDEIESPVTQRVGYIEGDALKIVVKKTKPAQGKPDDPNVQLLTEAGFYIGQLKPGQHMIHCPWEDEHTPGPARDDDTFYFEPHFNGHDIPAFKCHHDSCSGKKWDNVADLLEDDEQVVEPNWVYVYRLNRFWDARDGVLVDKDTYNATHAGVQGGKGLPHERFMAMKKSLKADDIEFVPGQPRFYNKGRVRMLNTYVDQRIAPDSTIGVEPWDEHLRWLIPDERSREVLCDWLAYTYQRPGDKIAWAPVLYSRSYGVGKTTVFNALAECIGRSMVSEPTQSELEDKFNGWCYGKLLVKIEELRSGDKYHVVEKLKPIIANPTLSIRRLYQGEFVAANVANVCASTNHMQALPLEQGDRRWMLIQCVEAGLEERRPRMRELHRWLSQVGYGGIAHWLAARDVSGFQPRGEAPNTELRDVVAEASMTEFDRAVELCDVFDSAGLISSAVISEYLSQNNCRFSDRRLGLIAKRRGWVTLPGQASRILIGGRKVNFWVSGRTSPLAISAFSAKKPAERERLHTNMLNQLVFAPAGKRAGPEAEEGESDDPEALI